MIATEFGGRGIDWHEAFRAFRGQDNSCWTAGGPRGELPNAHRKRVE